MKGSTLAAVGVIDASSTTIPAASYVDLPLFDPAGNALSGNKLPAQISSVQFGMSTAKTLCLGNQNGSSSYEDNCLSAPDKFEAVFSAGQKTGLKAVGTDISSGIFKVYFFT